MASEPAPPGRRPGRGAGPGWPVVAVLAGALALAAADQTIAGAAAPYLKAQFQISNTWIGLLVTAASLMAAATTLPFGVLADRTHRVRLLAVCALAWSAATTVAGSAGTYGTLLGAQIALGAGVGAAGPAVASLVGDLFPPGMRGRALGFILAGEFAGAASGLLIAGEVAAVWSWRGSFFTLAAAGPLLAGALLWLLAEPDRGAQRERGAVVSAAAAPANGPAAGDRQPRPTPAGPDRHGTGPRPGLILDADPTTRPLRWAIRYVLSVPSNVVLIIAAALCYFYVAGVQTFAIVFLRGRFDLGQEIATILLVVIGLGVVGGILLTGQISDRLIRRGHRTARLTVGGTCFCVAIGAFLPGFSVTAVAVAVPLLFIGAAALGGVNPPLDAARLDVMPSGLWGRAESVRTFFQSLIKSAAPLLFGYLSTLLAAPGESADVIQGGGGVGLARTFLVLLVLFVPAAAVLLLARRPYLRDVATVAASEYAVRKAS